MNAPSDEIKKLRGEIAMDPTDRQLRFRLGAALCSCHDYAAAIPELLAAQHNPHVRWPAMKLLAKAFNATGKSDVAARVRKQLSTETGDEGDSSGAPVPV